MGSLAGRAGTDLEDARAELRVPGGDGRLLATVALEIGGEVRVDHAGRLQLLLRLEHRRVCASVRASRVARV